MTGDGLHNGAETGPVDMDGARRTKSKHSIYKNVLVKYSVQVVVLNLLAKGRNKA